MKPDHPRRCPAFTLPRRSVALASQVDEAIGAEIPNVATTRQFLICLSVIGWGTVRQVKATFLLPMSTTISH